MLDDPPPTAQTEYERSNLSGRISASGGEQIGMETEDVQVPARWYQHPATAILAGIALAAGTTFLLITYASQAYGQAGSFAMLALAPIMPGFVVGLMAGREGDKWASISSGLFAVGMAAYITWLSTYGDHLTIFMMGIGLGVPAIALAALFGKLGEMASALAPRVRGAVAVLGILVLGGFPAGYWLDIQWELLHFKHFALPSIQSRFSQHVIKLPSDTKWTIEWTDFAIGKRHTIGVSTRIKGHKLTMVASLSGAVRRCRYSYEPPKPVKIAGQKTIRDYLRGFGASDEVIRHLRYYDGGGVPARSWFCANALSPHPQAKPCTDKPTCGSDLSFALLRDGTIRLGFWYYRG